MEIENNCLYLVEMPGRFDKSHRITACMNLYGEFYCTVLKNGEIIDSFTVHKDCLKFIKKISLHE